METFVLQGGRLCTEATWRALDDVLPRSSTQSIWVQLCRAECLLRRTRREDRSMCYSSGNLCTVLGMSYRRDVTNTIVTPLCAKVIATFRAKYGENSA